ncbi:MAG: 3-deoxy-7-phosphoheptulonate synthase class II [Ilumatobacter sp.]|jgi:3-deoxy-7-phosphoheptulonate synthase|uniref:class II 3-deoxy-7-phosphoheptulonate synthase n=1 Tax=Ilumatobacter sp. TaxID=1967498 RepID=UPI001D47284E|nr:3-deoxy-7-phosphoheptulonate synthase class II [Ilumatobacter sp.]MBT5275374.1 3-deoxy-7-phosphoheptulonate synthase class II [Ilumatobacter sp.]MBT5554756.1 3-deoxy-7-phosphoheptulonate synthase class II [Ilumatobacter sp.]MBT5864192.1 3-deoxy-7-phosphoheptulonate synthase class II [Ilumatobacter sp.]MDG0975217.1 3-deoxy-7-phosphoheptulonate synthase class II [Ilumatobacter sp.]
MESRGTWTPSSWQERAVKQQPTWPDPAALESSLKQIATLPPLVFAGEARSLQTELGRVASGNAFLLQAGDCAESFEDFSADNIREKLRVILQMAIILTYSVGVPIVKVGRMAGQFAKPRSSDFETVGGIDIPSFRGHIVNDATASEAARIPNPERLVQAYHQSASTLNLLRAFTKGGFADLSHVHSWTQEFVASSPEGQRYEKLAAEIDRALSFMRACGIETEANSNLSEVDVYTSHEALIVGYEEALTRRDSITGDWYDCSAHMLWIGERTRELDGAHVEFLRGVGNPIGCKVGPTMTAEELLELCAILNPSRIPGRLTLITRMGADKIEEGLRPLLRAVADAGHPVVWACDPMHGNTFTAPSGRKTRHFDDIVREISGFVRAHRAEGTWPGGIHVELTGENVTECLGGGDELLDSDLDSRYETVCDPRLNARQGVDLAFRVAELIQDFT